MNGETLQSKIERKRAKRETAHDNMTARIWHDWSMQDALGGLTAAPDWAIASGAALGTVLHPCPTR